MKRGRFEPEITDTIESAPADVKRYDLVTETGALVTTANADDAFGFVTDDCKAGQPVAVVRRGFCPINKLDGVEISQGDSLVASATGGKLTVLATSGGGTALIVAQAEEGNAVDGVRTGAYVDCIAFNREVTIPA